MHWIICFTCRIVKTIRIILFSRNHPQGHYAFNCQVDAAFANVQVLARNLPCALPTGERGECAQRLKQILATGRLISFTDAICCWRCGAMNFALTVVRRINLCFLWRCVSYIFSLWIDRCFADFYNILIHTTTKKGYLKVGPGNWREETDLANQGFVYERVPSSFWAALD